MRTNSFFFAPPKQIMKPDVVGFILYGFIQANILAYLYELLMTYVCVHNSKEYKERTSLFNQTKCLFMHYYTILLLYYNNE